MSYDSNILGLLIGIFGFVKMTAKVFLTTSLILHLCSFTSYTYAFMRLNLRAAASAHSVVAITNSYIKFESCPSSGPLNASCNVKYAAVKARFGPSVVKDLVGRYEAVTPRDACEEISPVHYLSRRSSPPFIAVVSKGNCSFDIKVYNAEKAGYRAVIIYAHKNDKDFLNTSSSNPSIRVTIPSFFVSYATGTMLAYSSKMVNGTRPSMLLIATRKKTFLPSPPNFSSQLGAMNNNVGEEDDGDNFGEHYFHICIYIWACVVISSLIGLSVKWGCCGRSLTRWEVTKIPLKRFRRNSGCEYQDKCPICHEEFHEGRLIRQLPCNHCYHSYCVDRWLVKMSNRCPLCKQRVSVSLFCSWNKQRDNEVLQQSDADLDAEASIGELPPLPPVQTLTPNSLYGDVIMSGPSKFILMRPGKATRVIEVPKKENETQIKHYTNSQGDDVKDKKNATKVSLVSKCGQGDKSNVTTTLSTCCLDSKKANEKENVPEDVICMETFHHHSSVKTSRSSSITSEHPLLLEEDRLSVACLQSSSDCLDGESVYRKKDGKCVLVLDDSSEKKKGMASAGHNSGERFRRKNNSLNRRSNSSKSVNVDAPSENRNLALEVNVNFSQLSQVDVEQCTLQHQLLSGDGSCGKDLESPKISHHALGSNEDVQRSVSGNDGGEYGVAGAAICGVRDSEKFSCDGNAQGIDRDRVGCSFIGSVMDASLTGDRKEVEKKSYNPSSVLQELWEDSLQQ